MSQGIPRKLQIKVITGLALLLIGAVTTIAYLNQLTEHNHASQTLLSHVLQLETQAQAVKRRATTYANHAPRDYAPYNRDVIIFYPDFMKDLKSFDENISLLVEESRSFSTSQSSAAGTISESVSDLQQSWQKFRLGFMEKLGNDTTEPRLEWGAEYVQENQQLISAITGELISTIEQAINDQLEINRQLGQAAMLSAGIILFAGIIWFYLSVIRRITQTVQGCHRVAQGDFGYQLPVRGKDELATLASAFNTLSSRTRFVLTMLSKMHRQGSAESKLDALWNETGDYLPVQWLGLFEFNTADNTLDMKGMRTHKPVRNTVQQALRGSSMKDRHLLEIISSGSPVKYDNLPELTSTVTHAQLLREFIKIGLLNSALLVPLKSDDNWHGLLVFVTSESNAYTDEQLEMMGNLSPYMANGFAQDS